MKHAHGDNRLAAFERECRKRGLALTVQRRAVLGLDLLDALADLLEPLLELLDALQRAAGRAKPSQWPGVEP